MLGRRQLREKAMQAIYAWKTGGEDTNQRLVEKNMLKGVDEIYDLYINLLNLLKFQKDIAEHKIDLGKNKNIQTEQDLNPNLKFVNNSMFRVLEENEELNDYSEKNSQLVWDKLDSYPNLLYKEILASDLFTRLVGRKEFVLGRRYPYCKLNGDGNFKVLCTEEWTQIEAFQGL